LIDKRELLERASKANEWAATDEGRIAIREAIETAHRTAKELRLSRRVTEEDMRMPLDVVRYL
jgi:hypothetical protein